jgi:acetyltransferase-like isoleucine patch superfamily enzyme
VNLTDTEPLPELISANIGMVRLAFSRRVAFVLNDLAIHVGPLEATERPEPINIRRNAVFEGFTLHPPCDLGELGAFSYSKADTVSFRAGRYCSIGAGLSIFGERHPLEQVTTSSIGYCFSPSWNKPHFVSAHQRLFGDRYSSDMPSGLFGPEPVIENDVWIGQGVTLARGITIGTGAVIGAEAVVVKDVEPYNIVGGNPAKLIRMRFSPDIVERLLRSEWWNYHPRYLFEFDRTEPCRFLDDFEREYRIGALENFLVPRVNADDIMSRVRGVPIE